MALGARGKQAATSLRPRSNQRAPGVRPACMRLRPPYTYLRPRCDQTATDLRASCDRPASELRANCDRTGRKRHHGKGVPAPDGARPVPAPCAGGGSGATIRRARREGGASEGRRRATGPAQPGTRRAAAVAPPCRRGRGALPARRPRRNQPARPIRKALSRAGSSLRPPCDRSATKILFAVFEPTPVWARISRRDHDDKIGAKCSG